MLKPEGFLFLLVGKMKNYNKPALSFSDQAKLLMDRGLVCHDIERCERYLSQIGYYRFSAYCLPFEHPPTNSDNSCRTHQFKDGTQFDDVLSLYIFDRKLRLLVLEAIERIEVAMRAQWVEALSMLDDKAKSHPHVDADNFKDYWCFIKDLNNVSQKVKDSKEVFVGHYRKKYNSPVLPPIWAVVEMMSFGELSRWVKNTSSSVVKRSIAKSFDLPTIDVLESVLHALTVLRNICAHHSRLWNRRFTITLPDIKRFSHSMIASSSVDESTDQRVPNTKARHIYNYLVVLLILMQAINRNSSWGQRLLLLLDERDEWQLKLMGFPESWKEKDVWHALA